MCTMGVYAAVMAYAAAYRVNDEQVINAVADQISQEVFSTPSALQSALFKAFDSRGIHMV